MYKVLLFIIVVVCMSMSLYAQNTRAGMRGLLSTVAFTSTDEMVRRKEVYAMARKIVNQMDDAAIIAQTLLFGWTGKTGSQELLAWIEQRGLGGIKIFGWNSHNLETLAHMISTMQEHAVRQVYGIPLIVATDQEGGWVRHIKGDMSISIGNLGLGAIGTPYDAYYSSYYIGEELRTLGINMNLAPVVDIYDDYNAHVIGPRSFGNNVQLLTQLSIAYANGLHDQHIISSAKHFPGHGYTPIDSHGQVPVIEKSYEAIWNHELYPYRALIKAGIPSIMMGHLAYQALDPSGTPASLSRIIKHDLLRVAMEFDGVILTDDLLMHGLVVYARQNNLAYHDIVYESLASGSDLVLLSRTPALNGAMWKKLYTEYHEDTQFYERIRDAATRVIAMKLRYFLSESRVPLFPHANSVNNDIPSTDARAFFTNQAFRAVTVLRQGIIPLIPPYDTMLVVSAHPSFTRQTRNFFPKAEQYTFNESSFYQRAVSQSVIADIIYRAAQKDIVLFYINSPYTARVLSQLSSLADKIVVVSGLTPVYLEQLPWVHSAIAIYGDQTVYMKAGLAALTGLYQATGKVPLSLEFVRSGTSGDT